MWFFKEQRCKKILFILKNSINYIIFVPLQGTKNSYSVNELMSIAKKLNINFYCKSSITEALYSKLILPNSKILIFGSLYLAGEALSLDKI